jgi:hypothetical protein
MTEELKAEGQTPEEQKILFGFDKEGYLNIRIHLDAGMWNILGALTEAQTRVMSYFGQMAQAAQKKNLVRPNGILEKFKNKWH